ncbi:MAG: NAD(P)/FAD-dependent oxidoreductase [Actinomycetota bacterium]
MNITVVGAGLSGLIAARELATQGHSVVVVDKGRGVGGRLATRRIGDAVFDHGAQFFTVRDARFQAIVDGWLADGVVRVWCHGFGTEQDGFPRYVGTAGMTSIAKHLAADLDVRTSSLVFSVLPAANGGWTITLDTGETFASDAVILTAPIPQSFGFAFTGGVEFPEELRTIDYDRTLGLLVALDGPSAIPSPGALQNPDDVFSFIGDNQAKGISPVPAVTFHANPQWSANHWDTPHDEAERLLREAAGRYLGGSAIIASNFKRWRFATPQRNWPDRVWTNDAGNMIVAGDAFAGPRVEGATLSGLAAAAAVLSAND